MAAALAKFDKDIYADGTVETQNSRWATLSSLAETLGIQLVPITKSALRKLMAVLKQAGYRSADQYISVLTARHVEEGHYIDEALHRFIGQAKDSIVRGIGPPSRAGEFDLFELLAKFDEIQASATGPVDAADAVVVAVWWLLREIEASALTLKQVRVLGDKKIGELSLGMTKTDIQGIGAKRRHECTCGLQGGRFARACPVDALDRQLKRRRLAGAGPDDWLFPAADGGPAAKAGWVCMLRDNFSPLGDEELNGHSMRRVGAKALAKMGVEEWVIMWLGRWGGPSVKLYIEEAHAEGRVDIFSNALGKPQEAGARISLDDIKGLVAEILRSSEVASGCGQLMRQFKLQAAELAKQKAAWLELADKMSESRLLAISSEVEQPGMATPSQKREFVMCTRSGKVHVAVDLDKKVHHGEWVSLCHWKLASGRGKSDRNNNELYLRGVDRPPPGLSRCTTCFAKLAQLDEEAED